MVRITTTKWQTAPRPVSRPLYAIGDVHGAADLLIALQVKLTQLNAKGVLVYLGDLIDPSKHVQNHNCARVLETIATGSGIDALDEHVLMGNHDQFFTLALNAARSGDSLPFEQGTWIDQGGSLTAAAWGLNSETDERKLAQAIWDGMSEAQRGVLDRMKVYMAHDDYLLVHAGFYDYRPLPEQLAKDWRSDFPRRMSDEAEHPFWMRLYGQDIGPKNRTMIVGHSPHRVPRVGKNVINVDTGAKVGGPLTMIEIVNDRMRFHQAWPTGMTAEIWEK
jgi:serine/threonine protein phosphatase 1